MIQFPLPGTTQVFGMVNQAPLRDLKMTLKHILYVHSQKHWDSELKLVGFFFFMLVSLPSRSNSVVLSPKFTGIFTPPMGHGRERVMGECQGKGRFVPAERSKALPVSV